MSTIPTTPGPSKKPTRPRGGGHPRSATGSSKRSRDISDRQGPPSSPSKKPRDDARDEAAIKSRVIPGTDLSAAGLDLPKDKKDAHAVLVEYYKERSRVAQDLTKNLATRRRATDELPHIVATIAAMYGPWIPIRWQPWVDLPDDEVLLEHAVTLLGKMTAGMIPAWKTLRLPTEYCSTEARDTDTINAQNRVRSWYNSLCCATGVSTTQACHIVANSIERNDKSPFWSGLRCFWTRSQVDDLQAYLKTPKAHERNLMILSRDMHEGWSQGRFAFTPQMSDHDRLQLEFHWLSHGAVGNVEHVQGFHTNIAECRKGDQPRLLQTGDIIELQTIDPEKCPYPDEALLHLQYHLNRVCCASAAAGLLEFLTQDPPPTGESEATLVDGNEELPEHEYGIVREWVDPDYINFLVDEAVEQRIITAEHGEKWRAYYNGPLDTQTLQARDLPVNTPSLEPLMLQESTSVPSTPPSTPSEISLRQFN